MMKVGSRLYFYFRLYFLLKNEPNRPVISLRIYTSDFVTTIGPFPHTNVLLKYRYFINKSTLSSSYIIHFVFDSVEKYVFPLKKYKRKPLLKNCWVVKQIPKNFKSWTKEPKYWYQNILNMTLQNIFEKTLQSKC